MRELPKIFDRLRGDPVGADARAVLEKLARQYLELRSPARTQLQVARDRARSFRERLVL
ncbi:MAG TPA: hypothetical protein VIE36_00100 [Methylomirabilota bacterium]|jgi:hypothetical protein